MMMNNSNLNMTKSYKKNFSINTSMSHLNINNHILNMPNLISLHFQHLLCQMMTRLILILVWINRSWKPLTKVKRWKNNKNRRIKGVNIKLTKSINPHPNLYLHQEKGTIHMSQTDQDRGRKTKSTNKRRIKKTKRKSTKRKSTDQNHVIHVHFQDKK